jgi:hypothetical protein
MLRGIALFLAATLVGCATPSVEVFKHTYEKLKRRPNRLIVSVAPNYIEKDGFPYHQGLLVRVHFFLNEEPIPMRAEGTIRFVAYDKSKMGDGEPEPVGIYVIKPEDLPKHLRKDIIGESYVFWLPYEPAAPTQVVVNASFQPTYGDLISTEPSTVHLSPLKHAVATANSAEKKRPRPNYVSFDNLAPKQEAVVQTIPLNGPPGTTKVKTIGGHVPPNAGVLAKQAKAGQANQAN